MSKAVAKTGKAPTLKGGNDDLAAQHLIQLVRDAEDGLRRVLKCGLFIEWIAAGLPHGKLMPWLETYCPDVPYRTIMNWRGLAKSVCELVGLKYATMADLGMSPDRMLSLPIGELPKAAKEYRQKIDELIEGKTAKQLHFEFKQMEEDANGNLVPKRGRLKGSDGNPLEKRLLAQQNKAEAELEALSESAIDLAMAIEEGCDDAHFGQISDEAWARLDAARKLLNDYMTAVNKARKGGAL